jgi:integrase/recombinase XerD
MEEILLHQFAEKLELLGYSKRAIADYPACMRLFFRYCEEHENLTSILDVKPEHLTAYATWLQYNKRRKGNYLSSTTIHARLGILKTFYRIMYREGASPHDYAPLITIPKKRRSLPRNVPSEAEMKKLIESVQPVDTLSKRDRCILELLYATGLRSEELRTLTVENLDLTERTLFVTGKGSKDRLVPVGDWVMPYLLEYLETARPKLVNPREPSPLLFLSKNGRRITCANLGDLVKKYLRKAGLDLRITPHTIRHACATHFLKCGADIRYVQELLGHADLSSTQIYTKLDISFLKQAHKKYHPREKMSEEGTK